MIGLYEINVPSALKIVFSNALYTYCGNNPIGFNDRSGLDPIPKWALNIKYFRGRDEDYAKALKVYESGTYVAWRGFASFPVMYAIEMAKKEKNSFKYNWTGEYVTKAFKSKVIYVSESLNVSPDDLMAVMAFESTLRPDIKNKSGYVGLIQFGKMAAEELGTTTDELLQMDAIEQMDYVYKHLESKLTGIDNPTLSDLYMAVFAPKRVGLPSNGTVYSREDNPSAYESNKPLDIDRDGIITVGEATSFVIERRESYGLLEEGN